MEILVELLGEICCELLAAGALDGLVSYAGFKTARKRSRVRKGEASPQADAWTWLFWILLPFAMLLTGIVTYSIVRRWLL